MSTEASAESSRKAGKREAAGRTLAQTMSLVIGIVLVAVGVLGFIFAGSSFSTGSNVSGENLIIFEVNGWHNIVHIATGAFLIFMAAKAATAITGLFIFAAVYAVVTIWGFVAGNDILGLIPVNTADNFLHLALTAAAALVALAAGGALASGRKADPAR